MKNKIKNEVKNKKMKCDKCGKFLSRPDALTRHKKYSCKNRKNITKKVKKTKQWIKPAWWDSAKQELDELHYEIPIVSQEIKNCPVWDIQKKEELNKKLLELQKREIELREKVYR